MADSDTDSGKIDSEKSEQLGQIAGFDVPRVWATSAQAFQIEGAVMVVFREQMQITGTPPAGELALPISAIIARNVASVVIPRRIAEELGGILLALSKSDSQDAA